MTDQEKEEVPFIREKIKEKPVNKRKLLKQGSFTVVFAVLFGLVACFVFTLMQPYMKSWLYPAKEPEIQIPADELSATEEESEEEPQETEEKQEVQETVVTKELELSDYQQLQNKIYAIGKKANRSVVTVTGVSSDTDWYNNAYESSGQASGIITMEDLIEEIVGDIRDEYDENENDLIRDLGNRTYDVDASIKLDDLNDKLHTDFQSEDYDSLAGYIIELLDKIPSVGEEADCEDAHFKVTKVQRNRIERVTVTLAESKKEDKEKEEA